MGVFCWGELAKSANDTTTIAQYIAAKILEHNISPQAHGLQDYALYNHRTDQIIDHADYSVSSEKITANLIVGKHFATDEGVGESINGIEFDRNAISMWNNGQKKVYIPKTGDPEFQGIASVKTLRYLGQYAVTFFENADQWKVNRGEFSAVTSPRMGQASFSALVSTANRGNFYINGAWTNALKNPEFSTTALQLPFENRATYITIGALHQFPFINQSQAFGFMWHRDFMYGIARRYNNVYTIAIGRTDNSVAYNLRANLDSNADAVYFWVNNELKATQQFYRYSSIFSYLFQIYAIDDNGAEEPIQLNNLVIQQDL